MVEFTWKEIRNMAVRLALQIKGTKPNEYYGGLSLNIYDLHIEIRQGVFLNKVSSVRINFMRENVFFAYRHGLHWKFDYHYGEWADLLRELYDKRSVFAEAEQLCQEWRQYIKMPVRESSIMVETINGGLEVFLVGAPVRELVYSESSHFMNRPGEWMPRMRLIVDRAKYALVAEQHREAAQARDARSKRANEHIKQIRNL